MFEIKIELDKESIESIKEKPEQALRGIDKGLEKAALFVEAESKKNFNKQGCLQVRTGRLRSSIESGLVKGQHKAYVGSSVVYAAIHQFGSEGLPGGVIKPKKAKALHFVIDGEDIFAKAVKIPARPFIKPEEHLARMAVIIRKAILNELGETQ